MRGLVVFYRLRELRLNIGMDSLENMFVAWDNGVCIPYLRENSDGVGEGSGGEGWCDGGGSGWGGGSGGWIWGYGRHLIV